MEIRTITAKLLREGPRHNHLLSSLTRYLGVSGDEKAAEVPYEHAELVELLNELRYRVTDEEEPGRRRNVLGRMGTRIAEILKQIPGRSAVSAGGPKGGPPDVNWSGWVEEDEVTMSG